MGQPPKEYAKRSETSQLENLKSKLRSWVEVGGGIWAHKRKMLIIIASTESILCVSIVLSNSFVIISLCLPYHAGAQTVKRLPTVQETQVQSLGQEDLLEKGMATHSSILAPHPKKRGLKEIFWRRKWQSTPVLLPGKFHGWRSLVGYSPRGRKESDTTSLSCCEVNFYYYFHIIVRTQLCLMTKP